MTDDAAIGALAEAIVATLTKQGRAIATAESCTGGWVAKTITDVAGSSAVFGYGIVSYSDAAKVRLLGVPEAVLAEHGAVSEPAVRAMAEGVAELATADFGVAISGIAGPDGGSADKPVGTVWFAWTRRGNRARETIAAKETFSGDRATVRQKSVEHALRVLRDQLGE